MSAKGDLARRLTDLALYGNEYRDERGNRIDPRTVVADVPAGWRSRGLRYDDAMVRDALWGSPTAAPGPVTIEDLERLADTMLSRGVDRGAGAGYSGGVTRTALQEDQMPTTTFPASPAQLRYINSLRTERGMAELTDDEAARLTGGRRGSASAEITNLLATPRTTDRAFGPTDAPEELPVPQERNRVGRQLVAGGLVATVTLPSGEHVTISAQVKARRPYGRASRWTRVALTDEGANLFIEVAGRRVGRVRSGLAIEWSSWTPVAYKDAVRALFGYAAGSYDGGEYGAYRVQSEDRCGRCGRPLTDPVSIDRGIGPECFGRSTGSRHARATDAERREARHADPVRAYDPENGDCGGCQNDEHCGACPCCSHGETRNEAPSLVDLAASIGTPVRVAAPVPAGRQSDRPNIMRARATIEAALKAAQEDEEVTDSAAAEALRVFDYLANAEVSR